MAGKITAVGLGPGKKEGLTFEAFDALQGADIIIGYDTYIDIVKEYLPEKDYFKSPMMSELERIKRCFDEALSGKNVCLVSSGDPGIYALASPLIELSNNYPEVEIEVIPGVSALLSGAALLGAPIGNDCAIISLSDLLTPRDVIEKRLKAAVFGDFVIVLYNPGSKKRKDHLKKAVDIMLSQGKSPDTFCGIVKNIGRKGEEAKICTLLELREMEVDMFTTVFVGNSDTEIMNKKLITKRGYGI